MLFLRSQNIHDDLVDLTDSTFIDEKTDLEMKNSRVVFRDVLLNITGASIGRSAVYNSVLPANVNQHVCIIRLKDQRASQFLQTQLASNHGQDQVAMNQAGGGREGLNFKQISRFEFSFPTSTDEIGRIEALFQVLNQTIALHERKFELLKRLKKAYLQKLFPANGSKVPKLRFASFTDDWEQRKLGELYAKNNERNEHQFSSTKTISIATMRFNPNGNGAQQESLANYKVLRMGDIAFEGHTSKQFAFGRFVMNDIGNGIMSPRFTTLRPTHPQIVSFWKEYIHFEPIIRKILVRSTKSGTMMNELVLQDFFEETISVSSDQEQKKIGKLFSNLNDAIALHQRKLEVFRKLKKSYLQKLFV